MDVRWGRGERAIPYRHAYGQATRRWTSARQNLQGRVHKRILHFALDREEVAPKSPATSEKRWWRRRGQRTDARAS